MLLMVKMKMVVMVLMPMVMDMLLKMRKRCSRCAFGGCPGEDAHVEASGNICETLPFCRLQRICQCPLASRIEVSKHMRLSLHVSI